MKRCRSGGWKVFLLGIVAGILVPAGARGDIWADYTAAVVDAMREGDPSAISRDLIPIAAYNDDLVWQDRASADRRVLMSAWGDDWYVQHYKPGDDFTVHPAHLVWVTAVPELKNWLREHPPAYENLPLRLEQLFGMPPNRGLSVFIEFWVRPEQMFRPSPDPEISDREAELDFPKSPYVTIDWSYQTWFNERKAVIYDGGSTNGWPWSRLGYTYDWGDQNNHVGLSEFVIRGNETVRIQSMASTGTYCSLPGVIAGGDYNGDGVSDIAVFRGSTGLWAVRGITRLYYGVSGDLPVPGDYTGDGTCRVGVFRRETGLWSVRNVTRFYFGGGTDRPVAGDYNGDGSCDAGIFRPGSGLWAVRDVTRVYHGASGDLPVPGDYDGDGLTDIAFFRDASGLWAVRGISRMNFGSSGDTPVPGDYDGGGRWTPAVFRPSSGLWAVPGLTRMYFGNVSDRPVPADYDGDSADEPAVFRESPGRWAVRDGPRSYYGTLGDAPVTR
ncbi:MAG: hypothetical protein V1789_11260 [PVC group bacterium]